MHFNPSIRIRACVQQATIDSIATLNGTEQRLTESILVENNDQSTYVEAFSNGYLEPQKTLIVNLSNRLHTNAQVNEAIVHSIKDQATTVSENLRRTALNSKLLEEPHVTMGHLD